jgi:hypothetical protein
MEHRIDNFNLPSAVFAILIGGEITPPAHHGQAPSRGIRAVRGERLSKAAMDNGLHVERATAPDLEQRREEEVP